jgi:uncharacterized membrane protein
VGSTVLTLIAVVFAFVGWVLMTAVMPPEIAALGGLFGLLALAVGIIMAVAVIVTAVTPGRAQ